MVVKGPNALAADLGTLVQQLLPWLSPQVLTISPKANNRKSSVVSKSTKSSGSKVSLVEPPSPHLSGHWAKHSAFHSFLSISYHSFTDGVEDIPTFPIAAIGPPILDCGIYYINRNFIKCWDPDTRVWEVVITFDPLDLLDIPFVKPTNVHFSLC